METLMRVWDGHPVKAWANAEDCKQANDGDGRPVVVSNGGLNVEVPFAYLFRTRNGETYDQDGLLPKWLWDPERFKEQRRQQWLVEVDAWAAQYGVTRAQALAILQDNKPIPRKQLFDWEEHADFFAKSSNEAVARGG
jgi:hypothetical protein